MVKADFNGTRVALDELEDHAWQYTGERVSVDGVVDEVLGPRIFTIDEPSWADLDGELLVVTPSDLAAVVREHDGSR